MQHETQQWVQQWVQHEAQQSRQDKGQQQQRSNSPDPVTLCSELALVLASFMMSTICSGGRR